MWRKDPYLSQESIYKCPEPEQGVNFTSQEGKKLLSDCLISNTANPFFPIIDNYNTQTYGSYCGPVNLASLLNAFSVDPKQNLMRNFRWYNESNPHALDIESVRNHGMVMTDLLFLFQANGLICHLFRPQCENTAKDPYYIEIESLLDRKNYHDRFCVFDDLTKFKWSTIKSDDLKVACEKKKNFVYYSIADEDFFRACVLSSCFYDNSFIMNNIQRMALGQKGGGHFMPIGAYHEKTDNVLLIDCARYKYNSRWQKISDLYKALFGVDGVTEKTRGFMILERPMKKNIIKIGEEWKGLDEKKIDAFTKELKFEKLMDKAKVINWLIVNVITGEDEGDKVFWGKVIPNMYNGNKKFKEFVDFLFMFDRVNLKKNILASILYLK